MAKILKLEKQDYPKIMELFTNIPHGWDTIYRSALEYGFVLADSKEQPHVALAFLGGSIIYGGDSYHEAAWELVRFLDFQPNILSYPEEWATLIKEAWSEQVKQEVRYYLPFTSLDPNILKAIDLRTETGFELKRITLPLAKRLEEELGEVYHLVHYTSLEDFVENGCCFCITKGDEICAAVLAACRS